MKATITSANFAVIVAQAGERDSPVILDPGRVKTLFQVRGTMKICLSSREVVWGGGEVFLLDLGRELQRRGHEIIWRVDPASELAKRIPNVHIVSRRHRARYDLLIANDFRSVWQAVLLDGFRKRAFVGHGDWQFSPVRAKILESFQVATYVVSRSVAEAAAERGMSSNPAVLPLGPTPGAHQPANARVPLLTSNAKQLVFGSVARLDPSKRLALFCRVTAELGARAILVVPEPASDGEYQLHQELLQFGNVEVRTGGDVNQLWADIDLFLSTADQESLGLAHLEALQSGTPVISTAPDGPGDFLIGKLSSGWIPGVEDDDLAPAIICCLEGMASSGTEYWDEAERVLQSRGIQPCVDMILGNVT